MGVAGNSRGAMEFNVRRKSSSEWLLVSDNGKAPPADHPFTTTITILPWHYSLPSRPPLLLLPPLPHTINHVVALPIIDGLAAGRLELPAI
jgi:hypothetical protein